MKQFTLTLFFTLVPLLASADSVEIDGIWYYLDSTEKQAKVTAKSSGSYSGTIVIPEKITYYGTEYSVTSIGGEAFYYSIDSNVTSTEYAAFKECTGLTSITIPNSVTSIGNSAFEGCTGLTSITIPNSVTSIGNSAFEGCTGLTSITIPNSVTSIGKRALLNCSSLTSITIPNSVTSIGERALLICSSLASINVEDGNAKYDSRENCNAIIETSSSTLIAGCKNSTIPNSVTSIGKRAFSGCSGLTSISIPNSVTSIGEHTFSLCI